MKSFFVTVLLSTGFFVFLSSGVQASSIMNSHNHLCFDVYGASKSSGAKLIQYGCSGHLNQQFNLLEKANGYLNIQDQNSRLCVRPVGGGTASGTKLDLEVCNVSDPAEEFKLRSYSASVKTFINHKSGKCVDVPGNSAQSALQLQIYSCNGSAAQIFTVNAPAPTPSPAAHWRRRVGPARWPRPDW